MYDPLVDWAVGEDTLGVAKLTNFLDTNAGGGGPATSAAVAAITSTPSTSTSNRIDGTSSWPTNLADIVDDKSTRDALEAQFVELKPEWIQNRSVQYIRICHTYILNNHTHTAPLFSNTVFRPFFLLSSILLLLFLLQLNCIPFFTKHTTHHIHITFEIVEMAFAHLLICSVVRKNVLK